MAKKLEASPRILREQIPAGNFKITEGIEYGSTGWGGYEEDLVGAVYHKVYFGYFDLSGYTREEKTTFIRGVTFQSIGNAELDGMQAGGGIDECLVVSTTPMVLTDFTGENTASTWLVPGDMESRFSMQQVVSGEMLGYEMDQGATIGNIAQATSWGLGDATAAEKLYYARAFRFPSNIVGVATVTYSAQFPNVNVVVPIMTAQEPDLDYIMRLKRSTEIA
jgi:hypothetical protein